MTQEQQKAILDGQGIDGATIAEWFQRWQRGDLERIASAVQKASVEQLTIAEISRLIRGTKEKNYSDGILAATQVSAVRLARTIVNGVSNNARMETIKENSDVIDGVEFVGTLDGKTCQYCAAYDGHIWRGEDAGKARRPPLHPNCRCTIIPYVELKDENGNVVEFEADRPAANADFDKLAKDSYNQQAREKGWSRRWEDLSASTRLKYFYKAQKNFEKETGKKAFEQVSGKTTFEEYFKAQPESFKSSWLGAKRYELYKQGKLKDEQIFSPNLDYMETVSSLFAITKEEEEEFQAITKPQDPEYIVETPSFGGYSTNELDNLKKYAEKLSFEDLQDLKKNVADALQNWVTHHAEKEPGENDFFDVANLKKAKDQWNAEGKDWKDFYNKVEKIVEKAIKDKSYQQDANGFPVNLADVKSIGSAGGSTGAQFVTAPNGDEFIKKSGSNTEHLLNECVADSFYQACGVNVPEFKLFDPNGKPTKLSKRLENVKSIGDWWKTASKKERAEMQKKLRKDFAVDVLLGNWDVVGLTSDNILIDANGTPWRIDNGGSLNFRARGAKKGFKGWEDGFIDDLWTMTGNASRIGSNASTTITQYFGNVDILDLANKIANRDWSSALKTLSPEDQKIVQKRLEEFKQIAERGNDCKNNGYTKEYISTLLDVSYQYSKNGLREACSFSADLEHNDYGWFRKPTSKSSGFSSVRNKYSNLSEYLRDTLGDSAVDFIEECNKAQGRDSYKVDACYTKFLRMRAQGYDLTQYKDWDSFYDDIVNVKKVGYYLGLDLPTPQGGWKPKQKEQFDNLETAFNYFHQNQSEYNKRYEEMIIYNAGIQIALENADFTGNDHKSRSLILMRTEQDDVLKVNGVMPAVGDKCQHSVGVNESHSIIETVSVYGGALTMVRVPYSRINGLYMMKSNKGSMYLTDDENEVSADTHGLNIYLINKKVYGGMSVSKFTQDFLDAELANP